MKYSIFISICSLAAIGDVVGAIHLDLKSKRRHEHLDLHRRANLHNIGLNNSADISYTTNLVLGGTTFSALVDTGSSDLWVAGSPPNSKDTGAKSGVTYAVGQVEGPIKTNTLEFAGYTINDQAYLEITPGGENADGSGLIGLGPSSGSNIRMTLNSKAGSPVLDRIFQQDTSTPNYLTVLLGRSDDPTDRFPGDLTVGEMLPGYEDIANQPKLKVTQVDTGHVGGQHWQLVLASDGIVGPDGNVIPVTSKVDATSDKKQPTAIIDTGFSISQVPKDVSDAIYSKVPGAKFTNVPGIGDIWTFPCDEEINLTFRFEGKVVPIHPLDVSLDASDTGQGQTDPSGKKFCVGAFQPVSFNVGNSPTFDMILGMSFLRNAYTLINYGDFVDGTTNRADPYIQLFAITNDTTEAHQDFIKVRLDGKDNGKSPNSVSGSNSTTNKSSPFTSNRKLITYIAIGAAGATGGLILISICCCLRNRKKKMSGPSRTPATWKGSSSYAPLSAPAPAVDMHVVQPAQSQYDLHQPYAPQAPFNPSQGPGQYPSPWDRRY